MAWRSWTWSLEDELYLPKRKVSNRGSHYHHHIIGSFFSQKTNEPLSMSHYPNVSFTTISNWIQK